MDFDKIEKEFYSGNMSQTELCNFANQYIPVLLYRIKELEAKTSQNEGGEIYERR